MGSLSRRPVSSPVRVVVLCPWVSNFTLTVSLSSNNKLSPSTIVTKCVQKGECMQGAIICSCQQLFARIASLVVYALWASPKYSLLAKNKNAESYHKVPVVSPLLICIHKHKPLKVSGTKILRSSPPPTHPYEPHPYELSS